MSDVIAGVYLTGVVMIFGTSTPNASLGGFLAGMITTGLGLGGLKACLPPFMGTSVRVCVGEGLC